MNYTALTRDEYTQHTNSLCLKLFGAIMHTDFGCWLQAFIQLTLRCKDLRLWLAELRLMLHYFPSWPQAPGTHKPKIPTDMGEKFTLAQRWWKLASSWATQNWHSFLNMNEFFRDWQKPDRNFRCVFLLFFYIYIRCEHVLKKWLSVQFLLFNFRLWS